VMRGKVSLDEEQRHGRGDDDEQGEGPGWHQTYPLASMRGGIMSMT
jgi:hypothetical protein